MLIATPYSLSAHERGQLGPVDYLAGPGDVWESRLKAEDHYFFNQNEQAEGLM